MGAEKIGQGFGVVALERLCLLRREGGDRVVVWAAGVGLPGVFQVV